MPTGGCAFHHSSVSRVSLGKNGGFTIFAVNRSRSILPVLSERRSRRSPIGPSKNKKKPADLLISSFPADGKRQNSQSLVKNLQSWYFRQAPLPSVNEFRKVRERGRVASSSGNDTSSFRDSSGVTWANSCSRNCSGVGPRNPRKLRRLALARRLRRAPGWPTWPGRGAMVGQSGPHRSGPPDGRGRHRRLAERRTGD